MDFSHLHLPGTNNLARQPTSLLRAAEVTLTTASRQLEAIAIDYQQANPPLPAKDPLLMHYAWNREAIANQLGLLREELAKRK